MNNRPGIKTIIENWKVVVLSFIGATTFWFFNALNKEYSAMISYPIEFDMSRDSLIIMEPLPETIAIDVSGGGWGLFRNTLWFSVDPIRVQLDNPTDIRYLTRSTLMPIIKDHLSDLNVNFLYTDTVNIQIEKRSIKNVKLIVDSTSIGLESGHRIVSTIRIDPDTVTISGPETIINSLQDSYYLTIPEDRIDKDVDETIDIPLPFEGVMVVQPKETNIQFEVDRFYRKKITVPLEKINFPESDISMLSDSTVTVFYVVQRDKDEDFDPSDFSVSVDYNMMEMPDSLIQPLLIYHPEVISEISISPSKVKLVNGGD